VFEFIATEKLEEQLFEINLGLNLNSASSLERDSEIATNCLQHYFALVHQIELYFLTQN